MICGNINDFELLKHEVVIWTYIKEVLTADDDVRTGRFDIVKDLVYANFAVSNTEPEQNRKPEFHLDYLDVHIIRSGEEKIGFRTSLLKDGELLEKAYDPNKDIGFSSAKLTNDYVTLRRDDFAIFYPKELHKPLCSIDQPEVIRKIVLKVHKSLL